MTARTGLACLALAVLAISIYAGGLGGPLIFDDAAAIERNPTIRTLWPPRVPLSPPRETPVGGRPLVNLSLAIDYAWAGLDPHRYHATNLAIHVVCGWLLFGLMRRSLARDDDAFGVSLAGAAIWLAHPLASECVLYATQRTESLLALFLLATLLGTALAAREPRRPRLGASLAISACALGMATKESMAVAPVAALLYDAAFGAGSLRGALTQRRGLYLGLAATWLALGALHAGAPRAVSVGFGLGVSGTTYLANQMEMLTTYLARSIWPDPLVLDYGWPRPLRWSEVWPQALVVGGWIGAALALWWRRPALGLPLLLGLLVLAPSSSVVPIVTEVGAERRMYLPLAGIVALCAVGARAGLRRLAPSDATARTAGIVATAALVTALAAATHARTADYASTERIWSDVLASRPGQPRALLNLGVAHLGAGRLDEATAHFEAALRAHPPYARAESQLGLVSLERGRPDEAEAHFRRALVLDPRLSDLRTDLGELLYRRGRIDEAMALWREALGDALERGLAANNLAWLLATHPDPARRNGAEAVALAERAARGTAGMDAGVLDTLAAAYAEAGRFDEARTVAARAVARARQDGDAALARRIEARLAGYEAGRPHRAAP